MPPQRLKGKKWAIKNHLAREVRTTVMFLGNLGWWAALELFDLMSHVNEPLLVLISIIKLI